MHVDTQFSVFLINKPGVLAKVTGAIAKAKINIVALALMDSGEHGALRIVCDDAGKARQVLKKTHDRWTEAEVLVTELRNEPGVFSHVTQRLADNHVNITYAYCTGGATGGRTTAVFKVADLKKAQKVLSAAKPRKKQSRPVKTIPGKR
ncbi:MAG: ACT domain-containing protein [Phycisphaerae bacterium]|nr:ACT domain-containing protein [Phycisphaerae bacterium]